MRIWITNVSCMTILPCFEHYSGFHVAHCCFDCASNNFLVIRFWRPIGPCQRSRIRFVVAFILSLAQICALAALLFWIFINSEGADFFQP